MKKNIIYNSTLSLVTIIALQGCGGSSDYKATSNSEVNNTSNQSLYIQKDGLSGRVLTSRYIQNATVCFDMNINGKCDPSEPSEKSYEDGKFSFSKFKTQQAGDAPLLANINDEYILTAVQNSANQTITPFTTLTLNEQLFNPYATKQTAKDELLNSSSIFQGNLLDGEDYISSNPNLVNIEANSLVSSFKTAYSLKKDEPLKTVATVADEVIKQDNFNVNVTSIPVQKRYDSSYSLTKTNNSISIDSQDNNQRSVAVSTTSSDKTIVHSKWNNRLTLIDNTNFNKLATANYLDGVNGEQTSSGASEKVLSKLIVSNNSMYSLVKKDKNENTNAGLGIYKGVFNENNIPSFKYASLSVGSNNYYSYNAFTSMNINESIKKIVLGSSLGKIFVFDMDDLSSPLMQINTSSSVKDTIISQDTKYIFALIDSSFYIYDAQTYSFITSYDLTKIPNKLLNVNNTEVLISFENSNEIYLLDISDLNNIQVKRVFTASSNIKRINLSNDKLNLAVTLDNSRTIETFLLSNESVKSTASYNQNINDFKFITNTKLMAITDFNGYFLELKGDGQAPDNTEKVNWLKNHRK
ncbi:hypothetical protein ACOJTA_02415 [Malaciobacter sp. WC5094]